jgi:hypothetical protein
MAGALVDGALYARHTYLIWLAATNTPQLVHGVQWGILGMSVTVAAAHFYTLKTAAAGH